ncbi:hypothetical protein ETAA8_42900 [Anatilimnocola aggregata]|uniref:Uncharacterized protein n=1 Tax=Anatilimnocola aggregata TaxID=2528021 RepID=A0A517YG31_9BACT|nr:hypothetical protein [Anatilimnocola aggregata]QDU29183.1 hypothetical protein ETAA8_42900 [Anatilimnocola aggregata]
MSDQAAETPPEPEFNPAVEPDRLPRSVVVPLAPVLLVVAIANLAVAPLMKAISPHDSSSFIVYTSFGVIASQLGLLSLGVVLGQEEFWRRTAVNWGVGLLLLFCLSVGSAAADQTSHGRSHEPLGPRQVVCLVPLIFLGAQVPLWIARTMFGWRLVRAANGPLGESKPSAFSPEPHLTLRDLFSGTAIVAITLGIARLATGEQSALSRSEFWLAAGLGSLGAAAISLISLLPLLRLFFSAELGSAWFFALPYGFFIGVILLALPLSRLIGARPDAMQIFGFFCAIFGLIASLGAGLTLICRSGWQLQRGKG